MILKINDIRVVFSDLLNGKISREEADRWAWKKMEAFDHRTLEFHPKKDQEILWGAVQYLYGIDTKISPDEYMHSIEDIQETFDERWST